MKSIFCISAVAILLTLCSCGNDKPELTEFNDNDLPYDEKTTTDRQYIEDTAVSFLDLLKPGDQMRAINGLSRFIYLCENYDFPLRDDQPAAAPRRIDVADEAGALESGDLLGLSRAVTNIVYSLSKYNGMYQANDKLGEWQFTENRDDLTFRFWIQTGEYNLIVKSEDGTWQETIDDGDVAVTVEVPRTLRMILYLGSTMADNKLITALIKTEGKDNDHLNINSEIVFANIRLESTTKVTNTEMSEDANLFVDNVVTYYRTVAMSSTTKIVGSSLCSIKAWQDPEQVLSKITGATSTVMLMKRIQIRTQASNIADLMAMDDYWYNKAEADKAADKYRQSIKSEVYFAGNTNKVRATLGWEPYLYDEWGGREEWQLRPTITMASDGATFDFASYFGNGRFLSVENNFETLLRTYKTYIK